MSSHRNAEFVLSITVITIFLTIIILGTSNEWHHFRETYIERHFRVTEYYLSQEIEYIPTPQEECQNAEEWPSCEEMVRRKKIGTCHTDGNATCLGEYVWLDDWGYQVTDYYPEKSRNYYPRSVVYRRRVWTLNITMDNTIHPQNITFKSTDYKEIRDIMSKYPIKITSGRLFVYRANETLPPPGTKIYEISWFESCCYYAIGGELLVFMAIMLQHA